MSIRAVCVLVGETVKGTVTFEQQVNHHRKHFYFNRKNKSLLRHLGFRRSSPSFW